MLNTHHFNVDNDPFNMMIVVVIDVARLRIGCKDARRQYSAVATAKKAVFMSRGSICLEPIITIKS